MPQPYAEVRSIVESTVELLSNMSTRKRAGRVTAPIVARPFVYKHNIAPLSMVIRSKCNHFFARNEIPINTSRRSYTRTMQTSAVREN